MESSSYTLQDSGNLFSSINLAFQINRFPPDPVIFSKVLIPLKFSLLSILFLFFLLSCRDTSQFEDTSLGPYKKVTKKYKDLPTVDPNLLSLDIYHFENYNDLKPVVLYVHGGGWTKGDKGNSLDNKLSLFHSLNYIFISTNYRLSTPLAQQETGSPVVFPDHILDIVDAIVWIHDTISSYGGNPEKMVLLGHSAGAQLVSLAGTSRVFLPEKGLPVSFLRGIMSFDTEGYDIPEVIQSGFATDLYINAFGEDETNWENASPIHQLTPSTVYPPFFIAKRGNAERLELANTFIARLLSSGVSVDQIDGSIYSHLEINEAIGSPHDTLVTKALKSFLVKSFE